MNRAFPLAIVISAACLAMASCEKKVDASSSSDTGPRAAAVEPDMDASHLKVGHPEQFPVSPAGTYLTSSALNVTGVVNADVSRQMPAPSLATGRVVEINARLGDEVKKGQLLFKIRSTDVSGAYSDYRKAVKNEELTKIQLDRAKLLFGDGAIPKSTLETAQNAEDNAQVDVQTATEHLHILGSDPEHPSGIVEVRAPVAGVVTDQQITAASGVQALSAPSPFTISDMSRVWIICDVYENDLSKVHLGEFADVRLNAYPGQVLKARIGNISEIMDPSLHTAKVRLELANPGMMRLGMFVTATFHSEAKTAHATVPATAVLHLHDRDWVYVCNRTAVFQRIEVKGGNMLPGNLQEIVSGIDPGVTVVTNALVLQTTVEQ